MTTAEKKPQKNVRRLFKVTIEEIFPHGNDRCPCHMTDLASQLRQSYRAFSFLSEVGSPQQAGRYHDPWAWHCSRTGYSHFLVSGEYFQLGVLPSCGCLSLHHDAPAAGFSYSGHCLSFLRRTCPLPRRLSRCSGAFRPDRAHPL